MKVRLLVGCDSSHTLADADDARAYFCEKYVHGSNLPSKGYDTCVTIGDIFIVNDHPDFAGCLSENRS
jgi:hypothetical protein